MGGRAEEDRVTSKACRAQRAAGAVNMWTTGRESEGPGAERGPGCRAGRAELPGRSRWLYLLHVAVGDGDGPLGPQEVLVGGHLTGLHGTASSTELLLRNTKGETTIRIRDQRQNVQSLSRSVKVQLDF